MNEPCVWLDDARPGHERLRRFVKPAGIVAAHAPEEVSGALARLEAARAQGLHAAGYFTYELGLLLEPKLRALLPAKRALPLLWFGLFEHCEIVPKEAFASGVSGRAYAGPLTHEWNEEEYAGRFARVHAYVEAGDIYQANLSMRSRFAFAGDPRALYLTLRERSAAAHCAYIDDGERQILSLSPEMFFSLSADGALTAKPMKGTAARGADVASDAQARDGLRESRKDRAENLMIVDLLRNDLGRIASLGSVKVENLFAIETFPTVHQMVSTVKAQLSPDTGIAGIVRALFPCGSITGAPKIRAMEIIHALESSARGVYCGAIGHFAPDGSAGFNVAIRTLTICGGQGELGIGGAIVQDSTAQSEYAECLLKAKYYNATRKPLELIETMRCEPQSGFARIDLHLSRMRASAAAFAIPFDAAAARKALQAASGLAARVRLALNEDGVFAATTGALPSKAGTWCYSISPTRTQSDDVLLRHKTSWRETYDGEHARLSHALGCDEVIFTNQRGELTEGSRTNIFLKMEGKLLTPPLGCGVLDGCLRRELLDRGECAEAVLTLEDLEKAHAVYLGNSLRGLVPAIPAKRMAIAE